MSLKAALHWLLAAGQVVKLTTKLTPNCQPVVMLAASTRTSWRRSWATSRASWCRWALLAGQHFVSVAGRASCRGGTGRAAHQQVQQAGQGSPALRPAASPSRTQHLASCSSFAPQGTLYPDVIESCPPPGKGQKHSHTIKSHHNVSGSEQGGDGGALLDWPTS